MDIEKELKEISERLNRIENKIDQYEYKPSNARPAWLDFIFSFVVVLIFVLVIGGVISFIATD